MFHSDRRQFLGTLGAGAGLLLAKPSLALGQAKDAPAVKARYMAPRTARAVWWLPEDRITFLATRQDTGGTIGYWLDEPPAGAGPPRYVHSLEDEGFYILGGEGVFHSGNDTFEGKAGTFFNLARGIPHWWTLSPKTPGKLLTFVAPAGNEGFFEDLGTPIDKPACTADQMPEIVEINRIAAKYGVAYMGPSNDPTWGTLRLAAGRKPTMVPPDGGDLYTSLGCFHFLKVGAKETEKAYTLVEVKLGPQGEVPLQSYAKYDTALYIRDGKLKVRLGDDSYEAVTDGFVFVPKGTVFGYRNVGDKPARVLATTTPAGLEEYLIAACEKGKAADADIPKPDAKDLERLRTIGEKHGVKVVSTKLGM